MLLDAKLVEQLLDALAECADDLAVELDGRHKLRERYPSVMKDYTRDMTPVVRARLLLQQMREGG